MRTFLTVVIVLANQITSAQPKFINLTSLDENNKDLYIGVDNFIRLQGIDYHSSSVKLSISHGQLTGMSNYMYLISVSVEKPDTLKYYENDKLTLTGIFNVVMLPRPIGQFGNIRDTSATISQMLLNPFLTVVLPQCSYKHKFEVTSFRTAFIDSNRDTISVLQSLDNLLTEEQKKALSNLKSMDRIYFHEIRYNSPDGRVMKLAPFTIYIK